MRYLIFVLTVAVATAILYLNKAPAAPGNVRVRSAGSTGLSASQRISPPEAGIKLIEDILQRVRNVPQLAMARQGLKYQADKNIASAKPGPTDYRLAIRPQEQAFSAPAVAGTKSNVIAWGHLPSPRAVRASSAGDFAPTEAGGSAGSGIWERDEMFDKTANRKDGVGQGEASQPAAAGLADQSGYSNAQGIWERERAKAESAVGRLSGESRNRLAKSAGRLAVVAGGFGGSFDVASKKKGALPPASSFYRTRGQLQSIDDRPVVQDYGGLPGAAGGGSSAMAPAYPASAASPRGSLVGPDFELGAQSSRKEKSRQMKKAAAQDRVATVAFLPPTVVTGIPLVRLGYSESQVTQALATLGNADRHKGSGWTVETFCAPGSKETLLQVYMRHGQVEALRIFNRSLVGPDFGVSLGDDLAAVKLRFGEPTFILTEPYAGLGQNYVYPISQVSFQLSRPAHGASPQVVSMLIFNVK